ncbi:hypothetical protein BaRGS_00033235, partial [Batillaria attramentaria]
HLRIVLRQAGQFNICPVTKQTICAHQTCTVTGSSGQSAASLAFAAELPANRQGDRHLLRSYISRGGSQVRDKITTPALLMQ